MAASRTILLMTALCLALGTCAGLAAVRTPEPTPEPEPELQEWTVMVYCAADNDLAKFALIDINEMEQVGSTDEVDVLVQFDGSAEYSPETSGSCRLHITKDADMERMASTVVEDLGEVDMGAKETLQDFIEWGVANYPAKKYFLVLWNHGTGWYQDVAAVPLDYTSPKDLQDIMAAIEEIQGPGDDNGGDDNGDPRLNELVASRRIRELLRKSTGLRPFATPEPNPLFDEPGRSVGIDEGGETPTALSTTAIREAMAAVRDQLLEGQRFELVGFDACLMAMVEVMHELRNEARFGLGSEKTEPGDGWAYEAWLKALVEQPTMNGSELSDAVIVTYTDHYAAHNEVVENPFHKVNGTLACFDLDEVDAVAQALGALATELIAHPDLRYTYWKAVVNTQHCGEIASTDPLLLILTAHRDIISLALNIKAAVDNEVIDGLADNVIAAVQGSITGFLKLEGSPLLNVKNTTGLSVYLPFLRLENTYAELEMGAGPWAEFQSFFKATPEEAQVLIDQMQGRPDEERTDRFNLIYED